MNKGAVNCTETCDPERLVLQGFFLTTLAACPTPNLSYPWAEAYRENAFKGKQCFPGFTGVVSTWTNPN